MEMNFNFQTELLIETGKICDILVEDNLVTDESTGLKVVQKRSFTVWADAGNAESLEQIEGITNVFNNKTEYYIYFDPRYDREKMRKIIKAKLLIGK